MPILLRYILGEYLKILVICLGCLVLVYLSVDFFGTIGQFVQKNAAWNLILAYFVLRGVRIVFEVIPIATLLSTLITLGFFSKNNEITAIKSQGISLLKAVSPLLVFSLIVSFLLLSANLSFIPRIKEKAEFIRVVKIKKRPESVFYGTTQLWMKDGPQRFLNVLWVDPARNSIYSVGYYVLREDFTMESSLTAEKGVYRKGEWFLLNGKERIFSVDGKMTETNFEEKKIELRHKPENFKGVDAKRDRMTFSDLREYIGLMRSHGYATAPFLVDLYDMIFSPMVAFVMTLLAVPLGLFPVRGSGISRGVGLSLVLATAYWVIHSLSLAMGHAQWIPPLISAGMANLLFVSLGIYLFLGIRS